MMRPTFKTCPTCGSRKIKLATGDYRTTTRGRSIVIPDVRRHECPTCGEILLDYEAVQQIEEARQGGRNPSRRSSRSIKRGA